MSGVEFEGRYAKHFRTGWAVAVEPSRIHPRYGFYSTRTQLKHSEKLVLRQNGTVPFAFHPKYRQVIFSFSLPYPFRVLIGEEVMVESRTLSFEEKKGHGDPVCMTEFACGIPTDVLAGDKFWLQQRSVDGKSWVPAAGAFVTMNFEIYSTALVRHALNNYRLCLSPHSVWEQNLLGTTTLHLCHKFRDPRLRFFELLPPLTPENIDEIAEGFGNPIPRKQDEREKTMAEKVMWLLLQIHKTESLQHRLYSAPSMWCTDKKEDKESGYVRTVKLSPYCLHVVTTQVVEGETLLGPSSFDALVSVESDCGFTLRMSMIQVDSAMKTKITWPKGVPIDPEVPVFVTPHKKGPHPFVIVDAVGLDYVHESADEKEGDREKNILPSVETKKPTLLYMDENGKSVLV